MILHVDWNQASIDSNHVCREDGIPGDYVQWTPAELAYLHDWNVIFVPDGKDWQQIFAAQKKALEMENQPAHGHRLSDGQGMAVRHRGEGLPRGGPQALRRRFLRNPETLSGRREGNAAPL